MHIKTKIVIGLIAILFLLGKYASVQAATPFGDVMVVSSRGIATYYNATTSSDIGRGTALLTAVSASRFGDHIYLASSTFDLGTGGGLNLTSKGASIHGSGKYSTVIKAKANGQFIIRVASSTVVEDLTSQCTSSFPFQFCFPIGNQDNVVTNFIARNVNLIGQTDGFYFRDGNANGSQIATIYDSDVSSNWDGVYTNDLGRIDIWGGTFNIIASSTVNSGSVAECVIVDGGGGGIFYLHGTTCSASGGNINNYGYNATGQDFEVVGGKITTSGTGASDFVRGTGTLGVTVDTRYDHTKTSGTISNQNITVGSATDGDYDVNVPSGHVYGIGNSTGGDLNITNSAGGNINIGDNDQVNVGSYFSTEWSTGNFLFNLGNHGKVGIGTTSPWKALSLNGNLAITGGIFDSFASAGSNGNVLQSTGSAVKWVATSTLGISGGGSSLAYDFPLTGNATSTKTQFNGGLTAFASSTIGNGTVTGGLTVNGTATTTNQIVTSLAANAGTFVAADKTGKLIATTTSQFQPALTGGIANYLAYWTGANTLGATRDPSVTSLTFLNSFGSTVLTAVPSPGDNDGVTFTGVNSPSSDKDGAFLTFISGNGFGVIDGTAGGNINFTAGNGGNPSSGVLANGNGGNIILTPGAVGTGGSGGSPGSIQLPTIGECDGATSALATDGSSNVYCDTSLSDQRLKTNVSTLSPVLLKLMKLNPVTYTWNDAYYKTKTGIHDRQATTTLHDGLLAQQVKGVFPELVASSSERCGKESCLAVDYVHLVPVLLKALQEQQTEIDALKKKVGIN